MTKPEALTGSLTVTKSEWQVTAKEKKERVVVIMVARKQYGRVLSLAFLLAMAVCLFSLLMPEDAMAQTTANLLVNPGAEKGDLSGWTDSSGEKCWRIGYEGSIEGWKHPAPHSGKYYFMTGWPSEAGKKRFLYQEVNIPVSDRGTVSFNGYLGGYGHDDEGGFKLELLNSSGKVISTASSQMYKCDFGQWRSISLTLGATKDAVKARVSLIGELHEGDEADAYFDDLSLTVTVPDKKADTPVNPTPVKLAQVKNLKVKNKKVKRLYISYKKVLNAAGYQIRVAKNKKMKKAKKLFIKSTHGYLENDNSKSKFFKKGKTYYVQVRAYRLDGGKKVYGKWSVKKKAKIKK